MSKEKTSELKRCPFCGGGFRLNMRRLYEHESKGCILDGFEVSENKIKAWNTRKPMERIVERLEEEKDREKPYSVTNLLWNRAIKIVKEEGGLHE